MLPLAVGVHAWVPEVDTVPGVTLLNDPGTLISAKPRSPLSPLFVI